MKLFSLFSFFAFFGLNLPAAPSRSPRPATPVAAPEITAFESGTQHLLKLQFRNAERDFRRALHSREDFAEAHMYFGVLQVQTGDMVAANKTLGRLRELDERLSGELAWVIQHQREKDPAQFFGLVRTLK